MQKIHIGITGASGVLGKQILKIKDKIKYISYKGDIRSKNKIKKWFKKNHFDAIFHLAAIVPIKEVNNNKLRALNVNYEGTKNIVNEVIKNNIKWFFFSSTSHVYHYSKKKISEKFELKPLSYYGYTKKKAESYIEKKLKKKNNIQYCIGRIFSISNKSQKKNFLIPDLKKKIKNKKKIILLKNLNHYRDFISTKDLAKIIIFLYKKKFKGIINLGSGEATHLKEIANILAKKYKKKIKFKDNTKPTYLIANVSKLKNIYKYKLIQKIEKRI